MNRFNCFLAALTLLLWLYLWCCEGKVSSGKISLLEKSLCWKEIFLCCWKHCLVCASVSALCLVQGSLWEFQNTSPNRASAFYYTFNQHMVAAIIVRIKTQFTSWVLIQLVGYSHSVFYHSFGQLHGNNILHITNNMRTHCQLICPRGWVPLSTPFIFVELAQNGAVFQGQ